MQDLLAPVRGALWIWCCADEDLKAGRIPRRPIELDIEEAGEGLDGSSLHVLELKMLLHMVYIPRVPHTASLFHVGSSIFAWI